MAEDEAADAAAAAAAAAEAKKKAAAKLTFPVLTLRTHIRLLFLGLIGFLEVLRNTDKFNLIDVFDSWSVSLIEL